VLNYVHQPPSPYDEKKREVGGERGYKIDDGEHGFWDGSKFTDINKQLATLACRREAMFCAMQPLTIFGNTQIGGEYQVERARETQCSWMSFPNIDDDDKNPWLGLTGLFRETFDGPNPRTANAYVRSRDFNNLYETSQVPSTKNKHQKLFDDRPDIVGLRWFQYVLWEKDEEDEGAPFFKIHRVNYEVIACTPIFNSEVGVSGGASGFVVATQTLEDGLDHDRDNERPERNDLFEDGPIDSSFQKRSVTFGCKTVLFGDLTKKDNLSLSSQPSSFQPTKTPKADDYIDLKTGVKQETQQSLQAATWRLRPRRYPLIFKNRMKVKIFAPSHPFSSSYGNATESLRGIEGNEEEQLKELKETVLQSGVQTTENLISKHTIPIVTIYQKKTPRAINPIAIAVFKEFYRDPHNYAKFHDPYKGAKPLINQIKTYNVGLRFIYDYRKACKAIHRAKEYESGLKFGSGNGQMTKIDYEWLQRLLLNGNKRKLIESEKVEFYERMCGMPIFPTFNNEVSMEEDVETASVSSSASSSSSPAAAAAAASPDERLRQQERRAAMEVDDESMSDLWSDLWSD
jgi:hypothetical protein